MQLMVTKYLEDIPNYNAISRQPFNGYRSTAAIMAFRLACDSVFRRHLAFTSAGFKQGGATPVVEATLCLRNARQRQPCVSVAA